MYSVHSNAVIANFDLEKKPQRSFPCLFDFEYDFSVFSVGKKFKNCEANKLSKLQSPAT